MNDLNLIYDIYKPYRITKINNCILMDTMEGKFIIKSNSSLNYRELYKYLYSRNFVYLPKLIESDRGAPIFEYQEDVVLDHNQKAFDMIKTVGLLHSKTCYYKEITSDKYVQIYEDFKNNVTYLEFYYNDLFDKFLIEEDIIPSHYLFLKNYSSFYGCIKCLKDLIEKWYLNVKDLNKMRVCVNHNNLCIDHFIKNESEYLISWEHYIIDTPVFDFYSFYKNEWENIPFEEVYNSYQNVFSLLEHEKMLLCIMLLFTDELDFSHNEYENTRLVRRNIEYLNKTYNMYKLIWPQEFE
ncbi:MAG: hypothetical protein IJ475_02510 [Bacilli bacterium]|nr:hypothetical protein [Bacilli bacterium]